MNPRLLSILLAELPNESRIVRWYSNDRLTADQHLMFDIFEVLRTIRYQVSLTAAATIGKEYKTYAKDGPVPLDRPVYVEPVVEYKFTSTKELMGLFKKD